MVLPVRTMSGLRCRSAWFMDTRHDRPSLFWAGADADCGADHRSICHLNRDANSDLNRNRCDGNGNARRRAYGAGFFDANCKRSLPHGRQHGRER